MIRLIVLTQQIDSEDYAILAVGKTLYAVITRSTKRLTAAITANHSDVLTVIGTIHLFSALAVDKSRTGYRFLHTRRSRCRVRIKSTRALLIGLFGELDSCCVNAGQ